MNEPDDKTLSDMMEKMLSFFDHLKDYQSRKVAVDNFEWGGVSTVQVCDGAKPYETAVAHTDYTKKGMVVVEAYDTKEEAETGHKRWVAAMTTEPLPDYLQDCRNSLLASTFFEEEDMFYPKEPKEEV